MKKNILYLTNLKNSHPEEDWYLIDVLRSDFEITVSHPLECKKHVASADGVIIRNVWPVHEYLDGWREVKRFLKASGKPIYNPLVGKGDQQGKGYLMKLFQGGYPVVPTVDSLADIGKLPDSAYYFVKPKDSCSGVGTAKLSNMELETFDVRDHVIQPFIEFDAEPSFFFIDNIFSYGITTPNRLIGRNERAFEFYQPTGNDLDFARQFIDWNAMPYGMQRIDTVRTKDGKLLLMEIEDESPSLYFLNMDEANRKRLTDELIRSMKVVFS